LDSSTLLELIHLELPDGVVVNNIEYNPKSAKFFKENFTPKQLQTLYYLSLGYNNESIAQNRNIGEKTVEKHIKNVYRIMDFPNHMNKRVPTAMDYRKAFPHLFPMRQYYPIKLTDRQYEVARMTAEGYTNISQAMELEIKVAAIERRTTFISRRVRDQLPSGYILRVHIANLFSGGVFYSKSNNPAVVR